MTSPVHLDELVEDEAVGQPAQTYDAVRSRANSLKLST
jgi:hypothetical protein